LRIVKIHSESNRQLHITPSPTNAFSQELAPVIVAMDIVGNTPSVLSVRGELREATQEARIGLMRDRGFPL
jgi:hypothetical protein